MANPDLTIHINSTDDGATSTGGRVVFDGAYWRDRGKNPTDNAAFFTSTVYGHTTVHGGTLELANGVVYHHAGAGDTFTLDAGATLLTGFRAGGDLGGGVFAETIDLGGATLAFDLTNATATSTHLSLNGTTVVGQAGTVDIQALGAGGGTINLADRNNGTWDVAGAALTLRGEAVANTRAAGMALGVNGQTLQLVNASPTGVVTWTNGSGDGLWNATSENWDTSAIIGHEADQRFLHGDAVVFGGAGGTVAIQAAGVSVAAHGTNPGMQIASGAWTFTGGELAGGGIHLSGNGSATFAGVDDTNVRAMTQRVTVDGGVTAGLYAAPGATLVWDGVGLGTESLGGAVSAGTGSRLTLGGGADGTGGFAFMGNTVTGGADSYSGQGGAVYASGNLTFAAGDYAFTGNTATGGTGVNSGQGGAVYAGGDVTFTAGDYAFTGNTATGAAGSSGFGGAVSAGFNLALLSGSYRFEGNHAEQAGGAVYVDENATLIARGGDVVFRGNTTGADADNPTAANALYLNNYGNNKTLTLAADAGRSITFYDPIASDATRPNLTIRINSTDGNKPTGGRVAFDGAYWLAQGKTPTADPAFFTSTLYGDATVYGGTLELANGAAVEISGNVTLDSNATLLADASGHTNRLKVDAMTRFHNGSTLAFDLGGAVDAGQANATTNLRIERNLMNLGTVNIDLRDFGALERGKTYNLGSGEEIDVLALHNLRVYGENLADTRAAGAFRLGSSGADLLQVTKDLDVANQLVYWNAGTGDWNASTENWRTDTTVGASNTKFWHGDAVVFGAIANHITGGDVTINAAGVTLGNQGGVDGLHIAAGDWTFTGGELRGGALQFVGDGSATFAGVGNTGTRAMTQRVTVNNGVTATLNAASGATLVWDGVGLGTESRGGAVYAGSGSALTMGGGADGSGSFSFSNNTATGGAGDNAGRGGAMYAGALTFTAGDYAFTGNTAGGTGINTGWGGAVYAANSLTFTAGDYAFTGNSATGAAGGSGFGGAILAGSDLALLSGAYRFEGNHAEQAGGAIYAFGNATLVARGDNVLFRGNTTGADAGNPGAANALFLNNSVNNKTLKLAAESGRSIFFDDPIASLSTNNNLTIAINQTGSDPARPTDAYTGRVVFDGAYWLDQGKDPTADAGFFTSTVYGATTVYNGTMSVLNGAVYENLGTGAFALNTGATLAGDGTVKAATQTISGSLAPGTDAGGVGTLSLVGAVTLNGAALSLNVASATSYDKIAVTGAVAFGATLNTVAASPMTPGTYDILTATGGVADPTGKFAAVTGTGADGWSYTRGSGVRLKTGDNTVLQLTLDTTKNLALTWRGASGGSWDTTGTGATNWTDGVVGGETRFKNGDAVVFDASDTAGNRAITLSAAANVASMTVSGAGDYAFSGAALTGLSTGTTITGATGALSKSGTGKLTFNNAASFASVSVTGGTLAVGNAQTLTVAGTTSIGDGTTFSHGTSLGLSTGGLTIGTNTTYDVIGYTGPDPVTVITSGTVISGGFTTLKIGGVDQSTVTGLDKFVNGVILQPSTNGLAYTLSTGGLVWNNTAPGTAHGTFHIETEYNLAVSLADNTVATAHAFGWDGKSLTKTGAGTLLLTMANSYSGGTTVSAGTLVAQHAGALGAGAVANAAALELSFTGDFANTLSGAGSVKTSGAVAFTGDHTLHSGTVNVASGSLGLSGAGFASAATYTVDSGAMLTGNGTVAGLTVSGTLSPGNATTPYGALAVTGNLSFNAGSAYAIDLDLDNGAVDALTVGGTVAIDAAAKLTVATIDGTATSGSTRIIAADASRFDGTLFLLEDRWALSFTQSIAADGYHLSWDRKATYADLASGRTGPNTRSLAHTLDRATANGIATTAELADALSGIWLAADQGESWARLNELSPAVLAGGTSLSPMAAQGFRHDLGKLWQAKWMEDEAWNALSSAPMASSADAWARLAANPADRGWRFWSEVGGAWSEYDSPNGDPGYTAKEWTATVAGYRTFGAGGCDAWGFGAAFNANHTKLDWEGSSSETKGDSFAGALMAMYERGAWFASLDGVWGTTEVESRRHLPLAGLSANADYRTHWYGADLAAGYRARLGDWSLTPSGGARWYRYDSPAVTEKGAGTAGLTMAKDHRTGVELFARLDVSRTWKLANGVSLTPRGFLGLSVEAADRWATPSMNFVGAPAGLEAFRGYSPKGGRVAGQLGLGLDVKFAERWTVYGEYSGEFRDREQRHAGQLGLGLAF